MFNVFDFENNFYCKDGDICFVYVQGVFLMLFDFIKRCIEYEVNGNFQNIKKIFCFRKEENLVYLDGIFYMNLIFQIGLLVCSLCRIIWMIWM